MIDGGHEIQRKPPKTRGSREFTVRSREIPADSVGDDEIGDEF